MPPAAPSSCPSASELCSSQPFPPPATPGVWRLADRCPPDQRWGSLAGGRTARQRRHLYPLEPPVGWRRCVALPTLDRACHSGALIAGALVQPRCAPALPITPPHGLAAGCAALIWNVPTWELADRQTLLVVTGKRHLSLLPQCKVWPP